MSVNAIADINEINVGLADGHVTASLEIFDNAVAIVQWSSFSAGQGHTNVALHQITEMFPGKIIYASGSGLPGQQSFEYWQHQLKAGRIVLHVDDDGQEYSSTISPDTVLH